MQANPITSFSFDFSDFANLVNDPTGCSSSITYALDSIAPSQDLHGGVLEIP